MASRIIRIEGLDRWIRDRPQELMRVGEAACRSAALGSIGIMQRTIDATRPYPPVDTGAYRRSWQVMMVPRGADLFNTVPYARDLEMGRGPHTPDRQKILEWARRKKRATPIAFRELEAQALARAATRALQRRGLEARAVMLRSLDDMADLLELELRRKLARLFP